MGREAEGRKYEIGLFVFIIVSLFILYISISASALAESGDLWINKSANQSSYAQEEDILYTITYKNRAANEYDAVVIEDIFPDLDLNPDWDILDVSPAPSSISGGKLIWNIGTLKPGSVGSISLLIKHPEISRQNYKETSSISGYGYVNARKKISLSKEGNTLTNIASITASDGTSNSSSVTVGISTASRAILKSQEHGSGYYKETLNSSLDNPGAKTEITKDLSVRHGPVELDLPGQKALHLSSLWYDRSEAATDDGNIVSSISNEYSYMNSMNKETSFKTAGSEASYSSSGNFSGGIAQIGYIRQDTGGKVPGKKSDSTYISETYHGDFNIDQSLDAYGESPTYRKESSGTGFVSSQKVFGGNLRSGEEGSGSYHAAESIQSGTALKNISLAYEPSEQSAGSSNITYASKWGEVMYDRDAAKGTEIMNRFSSADYIQKEAVMSPSYLSLTGSFEGTNYLKARAISDIENSNEEALRIERLLTGEFTLDTTIALGGTSRYAYPHINLTKRVLERSDYTVTYRIWVNNDGNATLSPVAVVDLLPPGASYVSSTLKPSVRGRIVTWTLQTLPQGETTVIDLKVILADVDPSAINRVQAAARFLDRTIISADSASPYDTIESGKQRSENDTELRLLEETVYGDWAPPTCFSLNSSISCTCERDIDAYYNSLTEACAEIP